MKGIFKAVIPAGGHGKRLLPLTRATPKEMLPLGSKPVLQHIVDELRAAGIREIVIVSRVGKDATKAHFVGQPDVRVIEKQQALGVGHSILFARELLEEKDFIVAIGDTPMGGTAAHDLIPEMIRVHESESADCVTSVERVSKLDFHRRAIVAPAEEPRPDAPVRIADLVEKPDPENAPSDWAIAGRYTFSSVVFGALEEAASTAPGEILLADALRVMIRKGRRVLGVPLGPDQVRYDTGYLEGYRQANRVFSEDEA